MNSGKINKFIASFAVCYFNHDKTTFGENVVGLYEFSFESQKEKKNFFQSKSTAFLCFESRGNMKKLLIFVS